MNGSSDSTERWFFFLFAAFLFLVALVGFFPNSMAILAGDKINPPLLIHLHAASMAAWLTLLVTQAGLIAVGRPKLHFRLGMAALILAPIILVLMSIIAVTGIPDGPFAYVTIAVQTKRILLFALFVGVAMRVRKTHPNSHKRLMLLATITVIDAAFFRMEWLLPTFGLDSSPRFGLLYQSLLLLPLLFYDLVRNGKPDLALAIGGSAIVGFNILAVSLL